MQDALERQQHQVARADDEERDDQPTENRTAPSDGNETHVTPSVASPEAFFADFTARADMRAFLKRLANC